MRRVDRGGQTLCSRALVDGSGTMVRTTLLRLATSAVSGGALIVGIAGLAGGQADPPGNNGTIKIDGVDFDDHPNNEPHVGCVFQVDFYGYDAGDPPESLTATVTFQGIQPTGGGVLLTDEVVIGEDAAGGGTDLDAAVTYDLTEELAGVTPHPEQGWHVRLTVNAEGSQGADTKHKVFWVEECGAPPTSSTTSTTSTTTTTTGSTTTTTGSTTTTTEPGSSTTTEPGSTTTTTEPGSSTSTTTEPGSTTTTTEPGSTTTTAAPGSQPGPAGPTAPGAPPAGPTDRTGELARTGTHTASLASLAFGLVGLGVLALVEQRRVRPKHMARARGA
jgi:hypothetical protein